jgi:SAM-dependent methyltransferase
VLEVGCGTGELLYSIRPKVKEVVGVEMSKGFVDFMNKDLGIEAYAEDINRIDLKARKFDLIICIATLDHLPNPLETLVTMRKLLSEKGKVYIELPNVGQALNLYLPKNSRKAFNRFFWHKGHFFYFDRKTLSSLMQKAGFDCEISCRHEYTLRNYLNWYFTGSPQMRFVDATTATDFFPGGSEFEKGMNAILDEAESRFHELMNRTFRGDTLCCLAEPRK